MLTLAFRSNSAKGQPHRANMAVDLVLNKDAHSFAYCKELQYILEYDILIFFKNIFSASL